MKFIFGVMIRGLFQVSGVLISWLASGRKLSFKNYKAQNLKAVRDYYLGMFAWMVLAVIFYYFYAFLKALFS